MLDEHSLTCHQDPDDVELIRLSDSAVTVDPDLRRSRQFALLPVIHCLDRVAELSAFPRFHFDEGDRALAFGDKVDVAPTITESAVDDPPSLADEPAFGDPFAELTEALVVLCHGRQARARRGGGVTDVLRTASVHCARLVTGVALGF